MDMLLLLQPLKSMTLTRGLGDYDIAPDGQAIRSHNKTGTYMWTSIRLCKPSLLDGAPDGPFSFLQVLDQVEATGRLFAVINDGDWHHISTPADLENVNKFYEEQNFRHETRKTAQKPGSL